MLAEVIEGNFVDTSGIRSQSPTKEDCPSPRSEEVSVGGIISEVCACGNYCLHDAGMYATYPCEFPLDSIHPTGIY